MLIMNSVGIDHNLMAARCGFRSLAELTGPPALNRSPSAVSSSRPSAPHLDHREGLTPELNQVLTELDQFISAEIEPLQAEGDNARFFDHRREFARTDAEAGGVPSKAWIE